MENLLSEIIAGLVGLLSGISLTLCYQKIVNTDKSSNKVKQSKIKTNGGDVAGRDINK